MGEPLGDTPVAGARRSTAALCLVALARHHGVELDANALHRQYPQLSVEEPPLATTARIAADAGFRARPVHATLEELPDYQPALPAIARLKNGNSVLLLGLRADGASPAVAVLDPLADRLAPLMVAPEKFAESWSGELLLLKRRHSLLDADQPFGLGWFVAEAARQRGAFVQIAVAAIAISVIALATPLFFQAVIDKVLVHHSASTLQVLGVGMLIALGFDALLEYLRGLVLLHATSRIDVRLATRSYQHLLSLPIAFFERATAGTLAKHLQQTTVIRQFLTGSLFMTAIDSLGLVVFLALLFAYSAKLTLVVLGFALVAAATAAILLGPYRQRLLQLYRAEGERQSHLVESLHGMSTLKSLGLEPVRRESWEQHVAQAVTQHFRVGRIALAARSMLGGLEKLSLVAVVWIGAGEVIAGTMTVGSLVAFQMLAGRVSGPLARLASLVHEFQEVSLSVRMLGSVMNAPAETPPGGAVRLRPALSGGIELDRVTFAYDGAPEPALRNVSLRIVPGSTIGIVGRSGSGKSTLARLIQGMYRGYGGFIRIDGADLRELDLAHLRRQLGVVPQESFLFRGTVRDNIGAGDPQASFEKVVQAARMAGADEFVRELPAGYDTLIEENAPNLSGGQRQRIAIARALLLDPRVLILDEATSALDPESEAVVRDSLRGIAAGRTLIVVSHRLSMLRDCSMIAVLARGEIAGVGTHRSLVEQCPTYRDLWNLQQSAA